MLVEMLERGYRVDEIVFADTKFEFDEMWEYKNKVELYIGREIKVLRTEQNFEDWFYGKWTRGKKTEIIRGFPKVTEPCYWSRESKVKLLDEYGKGNITYIGIASDEIKRYKPEQYPYKQYPLCEWGWTEKICLDYCRKIGLLNPLYEKFSRLGCWLCPKQNRKELYVLWKHYPDKWERLKELEAKSPHGFKPPGFMGLHSNIKLPEIEKIFKQQSKQIEIAV
jgi:3'-phosphoadenosine 5'-phosphosulfate sulfotransferase (PAPS reductase)/FAD synthetase